MGHFNLYASFIADGYADVESPRDADDDTPESAGYWYTLRNAEVQCSHCDGDGKCHACSLYQDEDAADCEACDGSRECSACEGSGYTHGEPFTVTRYTFPSEDAANAAYVTCEDAGDGYERAAVLASLVASGACVAVDVVEWEP